MEAKLREEEAERERLEKEKKEKRSRGPLVPERSQGRGLGGLVRRRQQQQQQLWRLQAPG